MSKKLFYILLVAVLGAFIVYEKTIMLKNDLELNVSDGVETYGTVAIMLLCSIVSIFATPNMRMRDQLTWSFKYFSCVIFIITVFFSIMYPLGSKYLYAAIILPFFLYCFMARMPIDSRTQDVVIWALTIVALYLGYTFVINNNIVNRILTVDNANNASYYCLYLSPFMLCHKKLVYRIPLILITLGIVMLSIKRGGFFAFIASLFVYILIFQMANKGKKFSLFSIIFIVVFVVGLANAIIYINDNALGGMLFDRIDIIEESGGAGRLDIYAAYLDFIAQGSPIDLFFGHGWQGSIRDSHIGATCHNDFLESLADFGIVGFILYVTLYIALMRKCYTMIKKRNEFAPAMGASVTLFFMNSMVSHIIVYPWYLMSFALFWGFMMASTRNMQSLAVGKQLR